MYSFPKTILTIEKQIQAYKDADLLIDSEETVKSALINIGYYRLRGYSYHLYNNSTKKYIPGTKFSDILSLYVFDRKLSKLLFDMLCRIEVSLRAKIVDSLITYNDALILHSPDIFLDKELFWTNNAKISSEILRSNDVFIQHNLKNYDGAIPLWATVEILSYGTLSKIIKNLKTGPNTAFDLFADKFKYKSPGGKELKPSHSMITSWIHATTILRNICAHNSRIYNRTISTAPQLIKQDSITPMPKRNGLYQIILAMKYLRSTDAEWHEFTLNLENLIAEYSEIISLSRLNFPPDWKDHFEI